MGVRTEVGVDDDEGVVSTVEGGLGGSSSGISTVEEVVVAEEAARFVDVVTAVFPHPHPNRPTHMANTNVGRILTPRSGRALPTLSTGSGRS